MKVAILTSFLDKARWETGVPIYGNKLIEHLAQQVGEDQIYLFHFKKTNKAIYSYPKIKEVVIPPYLFLILAPKIFKKERIQVVHVLAPTIIEMFLLVFLRAKRILTVHDLFIYTLRVRFSLTYPKLKAWLIQEIRRLLFLLAKNRIDEFIAVSQNTKRDLIRYLAVPENKITVIYEATDKKINNQERGFSSNIIGYPYILGFPPNLELLEIFKMFKKRGGKEKLVLFGRDIWLKGARDFVSRNNLNDEVIFVGFVSKDKLIRLYAGAKLLICHTEYEGFGFPLLEAISCGCPVVASDVASVPEVVGEAGILLKPYQRKKWVDTIYRVLNREELKKKLVKETWEQASKFSWEKTAKQTLNVYKELSS